MCDTESKGRTNIVFFKHICKISRTFAPFLKKKKDYGTASD